MKKFKILKCAFLFVFVFVFSFHSLFFVSVEASQHLGISTTYSHDFKTSYYATLASYYYHENDFLNISSVFNNLPLDRFYKVEYATIINFSSDANVDFSSLNLNIDLPLLGDVYTCNIYNFDDEKHVTGQVSSFETTQNGYFVLQNMESYSGSIPFDFSLSYAPSVLREINNHIDIEFIIISVEELTKSEAEIFQSGYDSGFVDGKDSGYDTGYSVGYGSGYQQGQADSVGSGYDEGYQSGFDAGVDEGYQSGKNDGYDDGYDVGFEAGAGSVNTDQYYQDGFDAGVDSVDTDSYYAAGYEAGLNSGYQEAYDTGYAEGVSFGYSEGYSAARESVNQHLTNTGTSSGKTFQVKYKVDENKNALTLTDSNTTLPVSFEYSYGEDYEFDYEREFENYDYESNSSDTEDYVSGDSWGSYYDGYFDGGFGYEVSSRTEFDIIQNGSKIDETYFKELTKKFEKWRGYSYYYMSPVKLFTADTSAYAYKITLYQDSTTFTGQNINWIRNTVGEWSDIMAGESDLGLGFYHGAGGKFTYIIKTDNLPVDIYSALLMYFYCDQSNSASFDLVSNLTFDITPYTRNEFAGIMSNIDDLQGDINDRFGELEQNLNQNFDDLMNSYDDSAGNAANDQLATSLNDFTVAEESLFAKAQEGIASYEFFDFKSFPVLVTGLSFVSSLMSSVYTAMGGNNGPMGIVLSVTFSVILVSMAVGLYRYFSGSGKGDGD